MRLITRPLEVNCNQKITLFLIVSIFGILFPQSFGTANDKSKESKSCALDSMDNMRNGSEYHFEESSSISKQSSDDRECFFADLSEQFDLKIVADSIRNGSTRSVYFSIYDKSNGALRFQFTGTNSTWNFLDPCDRIDSYSQIFDDSIYDDYERLFEMGWWGDVIVNDWNFDGKDDIAFVREKLRIGQYDVYLQVDGLRFERNSFLSDSIRTVTQPDFKNGELVYSVPAGVVHVLEERFGYDQKSSRYFRISSERINVND